MTSRRDRFGHMDLQRNPPAPAWTPSGRALPGPPAFHGGAPEPPPTPAHRQPAAGMCELPSTKPDFREPGFPDWISAFRLGIFLVDMSAPQSLTHFLESGLYVSIGRRGGNFLSAFPSRAVPRTWILRCICPEPSEKWQRKNQEERKQKQRKRKENE